MKIIADTHTHSIACSHAYSTVSENIHAAREAGMLYLAMTEHGPKMPDAPFYWHFTNQHEVPEFYDGVHVLHGVEADVMGPDGSLDLDDKLLASLDWVIASMHVPCFAPGTVEDHTSAWLAVAHNPHVDVIGHCGDLRYRFDYERVIKVFKETGKIVEINNNSAYVRPGAKENCMEIARLCKKWEVPVVVNSDAHFCTKVGKFETALAMLEGLSFPERLVVNADPDRFAQLAESKRGNHTNHANQ